MSQEPSQRLRGQPTLPIQLREAPVLNSFQSVAASLPPFLDLAVPHLRKKTIQKLQIVSSLKYATNPCRSSPNLFPPLRLKRTLQIHLCPLALTVPIALLHCLFIFVNPVGGCYRFSPQSWAQNSSVLAAKLWSG